MMRDAEPLRDLDAVATVAVEQLDDTGRRACCAHTSLHPDVVHRVDEPDAAAADEGVRATPHELVLDPAEAGLELVYDVHLAAHAS